MATFPTAGPSQAKRRRGIVEPSPPSMPHPISFPTISAACLAAVRFRPAITRLFSNSFSEGSDVQDENGAYLGFTWVPANRWSITGYSDFSYFVWPKYHTKQSTQCWDHLLNILYQPNKRWILGTRLRYKEKAGSATGRWRLYATFAEKNWSAKTSVDYTMSKEMGRCLSQKEADEANPSQGYLLNENLSYRWHWLRLSGSFSYFHTPGFQQSHLCLRTRPALSDEFQQLLMARASAVPWWPVRR